MTTSKGAAVGNPYSLYETNPKLEASEGVWIDYGMFRIRVRRAGGNNKEFMKEWNNKLKPYKRAIDAETLPDETGNQLMCEIWADTVIIGWDSRSHGDGAIPDKSGKPIKFSRDAVIKLFLDLPDLFADVRTKSMNFSLFAVDAATVDAGN